MGDVHPLGNPHFWLDPDNGKRIAKAVQKKLATMDTANAAAYAQREEDFERRVSAADKGWQAQMAPYKGAKIVTYHRSWPNFADHFGLDVMGYVEPRPVSRRPVAHARAHQGHEGTRRQDHPRRALLRPEDAELDRRETGAKVLMLPPSVGGVPEVTDYIKLFDYDVRQIVGAIKATGAK